jgi:hypothetical protein
MINVPEILHFLKTLHYHVSVIGHPETRNEEWPYEPHEGIVRFIFLTPQVPYVFAISHQGLTKFSDLLSLILQFCPEILNQIFINVAIVILTIFFPFLEERV